MLHCTLVAVRSAAQIRSSSKEPSVTFHCFSKRHKSIIGHNNFRTLRSNTEAIDFKIKNIFGSKFYEIACRS